MKKLLAMALSLVMVASLAACGSKTDAPNNGGNTNSDQTVYKITYANTVADSNPQAIYAKYMADRMKELSNGRIEMTVFNNNKLGAFSDCFQQMQLPNGTVQMGETFPRRPSRSSPTFIRRLPCPSCSPARSSLSISMTIPSR